MTNKIIKLMQLECNFCLLNKARQAKAGKATTICLNYVSVVTGKNVQLMIGERYKIFVPDWNTKRKRPVCPPYGAGLIGECYIDVCRRLHECEQLFAEWKRAISAMDAIPDNADAILKEMITGKQPAGMTETKSLIEQLTDDVNTRKDVTDGTKAVYLSAVNHFGAFLSKQGRKVATISDVSAEMLQMFRNYLIDAKLRPATTNDVIKRTRQLLDRAGLDAQKLKKFDYIKKKEEVPRFIVTEQELCELYALELTGREKTVRDIFCVQAWIGQRISDMSLKNAVFDAGSNILTLMQAKTAKQVKIPLLNDRVKQLLIDNNFRFTVPETMFNSTLQRICRRLPFMQNEIVFTEQRGTAHPEQKTAKRCDLITSHVARHSFCTNRLIDGWTSEQVRAISGHSPQAFEIYNHLCAEHLKMNELIAATRQTAPQTESKQEYTPPAPMPEIRAVADLMSLKKHKEMSYNSPLDFVEAYNQCTYVPAKWMQEARKAEAREFVEYKNFFANARIAVQIAENRQATANPELHRASTELDYQKEMTLPNGMKYTVRAMSVDWGGSRLTYWDAVRRAIDEAERRLCKPDETPTEPNPAPMPDEVKTDLTKIKAYVRPDLFVKRGRQQSKIDSLKDLTQGRTAKDVAAIAKYLFTNKCLTDRYKHVLKWEQWLTYFYDAAGCPEAYHYRASEVQPDVSLKNSLDALMLKTTK